MALAVAASDDKEVFQLDVQTAFPDADVQEEVHVNTPPGYESLDDTTGCPNVMKLKHSLYGLRHSPRNRSNTIDASLRDMGFTATAPDPCVYIFSSDDSLGILTMCTEDLLLLGRDTPLLMDVSMVLGMQITREREATSMTIS